MSQERFTLSDQEQVKISHFQSQSPKMVQWIIKHSGGYIKNDEQANYVLIGTVLLSVLTSFFLLFDFSSEPQQDFIILPEETVGSPQGMPK